MTIEARPFGVGDKVTTKFHPDHRDVVRTVTMVKADREYDGGYAVSVDGGEECSECGQQRGQRIEYVSVEWLERAEP